MNVQEQIEAIKSEAIAAANAGKGPSAFPYMPKSEAAATWRDAFYTQLTFLFPAFGRIA